MIVPLKPLNIINIAHNIFSLFSLNFEDIFILARHNKSMNTFVKDII